MSAKSPIERRRHKRLPISCPVMIEGQSPAGLTKARAIDLSDGGVYLTVPTTSVPQTGKKITIKLMLPRSTPNTRMVEQLALEAKVLRHVALKDASRLGLGLQFIQPPDLGLEV